MRTWIIKSYQELIKLQSFEERFAYLKIGEAVGAETFGYERMLNQIFYRSPEWKHLRREVIIRDGGCDLGISDRVIIGRIEIHHINPITAEDIEKKSDIILDPDNLICTSPNTHKAIHFSDDSILVKSNPIIRKPYDTCPWRQ